MKEDVTAEEAQGPEGTEDAAEGTPRRRRRRRHWEPADADDSDGPDADISDELPGDLDVTALSGPYLFPDNNRRRVPAVLYLVLGAGAVLLWALTTSDADPVLVNDGFLIGGVILCVFAAFSWQAGFDLDVDERDALVAAGRVVGFPVGHASAQLGWRGLRSRPTWRVLVFSDENPPARRGLVLVDGCDGRVIEHFVEDNPDNPEDWA